MTIVGALSTEFCYGRPALQNKYKSSPTFSQNSRDIPSKCSASSTVSPLRLGLGQGRRQYSDTAKSSTGAIVTREKDDDHGLFDAAEAEAMALVQQHQATYMSNRLDRKKDDITSPFPNPDSLPVYAKGREVLASSLSNVHWADDEIRNTKQSRHATGSMPNEVDHRSSTDSGSADVDYHTEQAEKAIPSLAEGTNSRRNPFQRARLNRTSQSTNTRITTARTIYSRDSNELPSLVRDSRYTSNSPAPSPEDAEREPAEETSLRYRDGVEIRSDEIRAATSMKLGDRSPRLPGPSLVSRSPKRPIVSFAPGTLVDNSKPLEKQQSTGHAYPLQPLVDQNSSIGKDQNNFYENNYSNVNNDNNNNNIGYRTCQQDSIGDEAFQSRHETSSKTIPIFQFSCNNDTIPTKQIQDNVEEQPSIPSIVVSEDVSDSQTESPRGQKHNKAARQRDHVGQNTTHFPERQVSAAKAPSCSFSRFGALCNNCALPISGRIVSAAGHRFHPECFRCYHCGEGLECVAFYPEPESKREERLLRSFEDLNCIEGTDSEADINLDNDASMRFYCHLDYHEFFSPRCKSCKTPIEGEVVVACGAHWHVGHFFCAECGDPFESSTPFVERDGYAWCIRCHTNRQSAKCKRCKKPVTDLVVSALGSEWHNNCFSCSECGSQFENGVYFLRDGTEDPVCLACEEIRLKA